MPATADCCEIVVSLLLGHASSGKVRPLVPRTHATVCQIVDIPLSNYVYIQVVAQKFEPISHLADTHQQMHMHIHMYTQELYQTGCFDPSDALGSLNSIVICFLGVQAGRIMIHHQGHTGILVWLAVLGTVLRVLGTVLCEGQKNEGIMPINKNLW